MKERRLRQTGIDQPFIQQSTTRRFTKIHVFSPEQEILHTPPAAEDLAVRLMRLCDFANRKDEGKDFLPFCIPSSRL